MKSIVLFFFAFCPYHSVKDNNNKYKEKQNALQMHFRIKEGDPPSAVGGNEKFCWKDSFIAWWEPEERF